MKRQIPVAIVVDCAIYQHSVALVIGDANALSWHLRKHGCRLSADLQSHIEETSRQTMAWTFYSDEKLRDVIIYAREPLDVATLVHEICHATQKTLSNAGVTDDEAFAYLAEYLFTEFTSSEASAQLLRLPCAFAHIRHRKERPSK